MPIPGVVLVAVVMIVIMAVTVIVLVMGTIVTDCRLCCPKPVKPIEMDMGAIAVFGRLRRMDVRDSRHPRDEVAEDEHGGQATAKKHVGAFSTGTFKFTPVYNFRQSTFLSMERRTDGTRSESFDWGDPHYFEVKRSPPETPATSVDFVAR